MIAYLLHLDHELFWCINSHHNAFFDAFFLIVTNLGNGWYVAPILLSIVFFKVPRKKLVPYILYGTFFMVASGMINSQIKQAVDRPRPLGLFTDASEKPKTSRMVHALVERHRLNSFPSGHTNTAFSAAVLLALSFGNAYWLAFVAAALVGYSRMYLGVHFPSDIVGGALLAIGIMYLWHISWKSYERKGNKKSVE